MSRRIVAVVSGLCGVVVPVVAASVVGGASASVRQTGTLVVNVVTDPTPAGVSWTYSGVDTPFKLGKGTSEKTLTPEAGTYQLHESPAAVGQPKTLTALSCQDPTGNTTANVGAASASISLDAGETITCTFTHRALGRLSAAATLALARKYAPILRLTSGERYRPLRLEDYLSVSSLHAGTPPRGALLQPHPTLFSLPTKSGSSYLDVVGAESNSHSSRYVQTETRLEAATPRSTVYWHLVRQRATGRIAVEYWFFYLYNDFYDRHEADWEGVTIFLQGTNPLGVSYSEHQGRGWSPWSAQRTTGTHPIVYVARGSHANYPKAGRYSIRVCWTLARRRCATSPRADIATGSGPTLRPPAYDLQELGGTPFSGDWGSGTYILGIGRTHDHVTDPRRRTDYTDPFTVLAR